MSTVEGWKRNRLDEIGTIFSGSTPSTSIRAFWDGEIVWITPNDISKLNTPYLHDSAKRITEKGLNGCSAHLLSPHSLVLSSRAPIGYVAIPSVQFCTNQGCKTIKLKSNFHPEFTYYIVMRPFPQTATGRASLADQWTAYRKAMIDHAGIAVFVFGNKLDPGGHIILSNGMRQEFDLCLEAGVQPLPIGATGYMADTLWKEVWNNFKMYYPGVNSAFRDEFEKLADRSMAPSGLISVIQTLIQRLQRG